MNDAELEIILRLKYFPIRCDEEYLASLPTVFYRSLYRICDRHGYMLEDKTCHRIIEKYVHVRDGLIGSHHSYAHLLSFFPLYFMQALKELHEQQ